MRHIPSRFLWGRKITRCSPSEDPVGSRLHGDVAALVLYVGDDGDDEPDHLDWPAPGAALLLAGDTVLQGGGGHVLRSQPGEATSCRGAKEGQECQEMEE